MVTGLEHESFPPPGIDLSRPSVARVYDCYLGGTANWEIDRQFAERMLRDYPMVRPIARANRRFLHRVVRHLVRGGVRQIVDLGSGVPTMGHAHEIAEQIAPGEVKVAYVDCEPVAVAHSTSLLREQGDPARQLAVHADLRDARRLWSLLAGSGVIDLDQPIALLLISVLHFRQPPAPGSGSTADLGPRLTAEYRDLLVPGSYLALSHVTDEGVPPHCEHLLADAKQRYAAAGTGLVYRDRAEITGLFGDFALLEPGVTWTPLWHPEEAGPDDPTVPLDAANESLLLAGVARKE
ncbi:SAM-dependent methyltransferase [Amycolatopsis rubida]|uniref:S-adenosyl methyltransferase n=1 Tax=Amycolatopsis rubida TaxID=112413 RepID=A0A1I5HUS7_9PSEU|nr:SAM-dependent methyltransferase [Amycolatopsis rubida]SFO52055.1 S-adenosyl methyltransferase [Amycolatopsis rubida]